MGGVRISKLYFNFRIREEKSTVSTIEFIVNKAFVYTGIPERFQAQCGFSEAWLLPVGDYVEYPTH